MSLFKEIFYLSVCLNIIIQIVSCQINWQGSWAMDCDFNGNDFSSARVPGEQCSSKCQQTSGCTHFAWNDYEGGTCWMKKGPISKFNAISKQNTVCGIISTSIDPSPPNGFRKMVNFNFDIEIQKKNNYRDKFF